MYIDLQGIGTFIITVFFIVVGFFILSVIVNGVFAPDKPKKTEEEMKEFEERIKLWS